MSTQRTVIFGDRGARTAPREALGGKAFALAELDAIGARIPPWFCVSSPTFASIHARVREELAKSDDAPAKGGLRARAERVRALVREHGIDADTRREILAAFDAMFPKTARVAVRSSAVGEDSGRDSFAGQLDTFLFVTREAVVDRVLDVVASPYSERALAYAQRRGLAAEPVRVAVLVQEMIDGRASGVLFTANPTTSDRSEAVIAAGLGLGEGIVAGRVEADTFFLSVEDGRIRQKRILEKHHSVVFDAMHGTALVDVTGEDVGAPAISDQEAEQIFAVARKVEMHFGVPQDIEWTIDRRGAIHVLQARPITTLERETIFDSSNIVESFPGLTLPLTFTFARRSYEDAFREAQRRTGIPEAILEANRHVHENLIGLVEGRVYYNILNWYRLFTWVPGFEGLLPAWEKALGIDRRLAPPSRQASGLADRIAQLHVLESTLRGFVVLQKDIDAYLADLAAVQDDLARLDLALLDAHQLLERMNVAKRRLLTPYAVSVLNDLYAQQVYDRVAKLITAWKIGDATTLRNELLCGESGMESVAPVRSLVAIAKTVRDTPSFARALDSGDDVAVARRVREDASLSALRASIDEHMRLYGDRTLEELKLETPPLSDRPEFIIAMIRNYVRGKLDVAVMEGHEREIRGRAEEIVRRALENAPFRRRTFDFFLGHARRLVKNREALRLARSRAFGIVRTFYREIARKLVARGVLERDEDVFYLTTDEVDAAVFGAGVTRDLMALVRLRRTEWDAYAKTTPMARVIVRGPVQGARIEHDAGDSVPSGDVLTGIPCSPGKNMARAKVVLDPDREPELSGEILIAPMTDPAWAYLMVAAGGLVAERGSVLSHTAIIGRELGIPTVVGVVGATRAISSGQMVEIDGTAGTVRLVAATED